jgi:hypothetical protein
MGVVLADGDDWAAAGTVVSTTSAAAVPVTEWTHLGYAVSLDAATTGVSVDFWINDSAHETKSLADRFFIDDVLFYDAFIGAHRTADAAFGGYLTGFIYTFAIYNQAVADSPKYGNENCSGCGAMKCTTVTTACLGDWEFVEYEASGGCNVDDSCDGKGCVRP